MENIHRLLQRQLKRYRKEQDIPCDWMEFLQVVNEVYHQSDADRRMLEHSLEISSKELLEANLELRNNAEILLAKSMEGKVCQY